MTEYLGPKSDADNLSTQGDLNKIVQESATAPESPSAGDLWFNSNIGKLFVYYDSYWVQPASIGAEGPQPELATSSPTTIQPDDTGAAGSGNVAARSDHTHAILTSAATSITGTNSEGTSTSFARADHGHALSSGVVGTSAIADGSVTAAKLNADTFSKAQTVDTKSDSYTLLTADAGKMIAMNKSTAQTVTINGSLDLAVGQRIDVIQTGAGQVTFSASSATVNGTPGLKTRAQYSVASVIATGTDTYVVFGDLAS